MHIRIFRMRFNKKCSVNIILELMRKKLIILTYNTHQIGLSHSLKIIKSQAYIPIHLIYLHAAKLFLFFSIKLNV